MFSILRVNSAQSADRKVVRRVNPCKRLLNGLNVHCFVFLGNIWVEFQHEGRTSCTGDNEAYLLIYFHLKQVDRFHSDLVGHQLSREYDSQASLMTTEMNTFENLSDGFNKLFALANGFPPSCNIDNFNKIHFLDILVGFQNQSIKMCLTASAFY